MQNVITVKTIAVKRRLLFSSAERHIWYYGSILGRGAAKPPYKTGQSMHL